VAENETIHKPTSEAPKRSAGEQRPITQRLIMLALLENIVWACAFVALLLLLDGWAKAWAILPYLLVHDFAPARRK